MRYTVTWAPRAQDELATIWMKAKNKKAVTEAADMIDRLLRTAPLDQGIPLGPIRFWLVGPLVVHYRVSPEDCLVEVQEIWFMQ